MAKKGKFDDILSGAVKRKTQSESSIKQNIHIEEELRDFIPPLSEEEFAQLEDNILREGCRDALILWKNKDQYVLIDGHNRHRICSAHKLDFKIELKDFKDLDQVKEWMILNQLGKRNISELAKSYLRGEQYELEKKNKTHNLKQNQKSPKGQNELSVSTAQRLAEINKVSESTIKRDQKYAQGIKKLTGNDTLFKWKILNKELDLSKDTVSRLVELKSPQLRQFRELLHQNQLKQALDYVEQLDKPAPQKPEPKPQSDLQVHQGNIQKALRRFAREPNAENYQQIELLIAQLKEFIAKKA